MKRTTISILAAIALAFLGGPAAHAALCPPGNLATPFSAGPVNPNNGFAEFVTDSNGLSLELCLAGDGATGPCFFDPAVPGNLFSQQIGFGAEAFWWLAEAIIDIPATGLSAIVVLATEAAFLTENPADGQQFPFTRLRIRVDVPQPGVYAVTHPYGTETFTVEAVGAGQEIRTSNDIEFQTPIPPATTAQNQGCVGPWLRWDGTDPALPAGFIGDGATPHTVIGGPNGNVFQVSAVDLNGATIDLAGNGDNTVSTNLFTVWGKVYDGQLATPMVVNRTSYDRADSNNGQVDVFATGAQTATVTFSGGPNLPPGPIPLAGDPSDPRVANSVDNTMLFFASVGLAPDASAVPPTVGISATDAATDPTQLLRLVTDVVTITRAEYNLADNVLTVEAASSDALLAGALTLAEYGVPVPARIATPAPPGVVNVFSPAGGAVGAQVAVINNAPPVAANDAFTVGEDSVGNALPVLDNDTDANGLNAASVAIVAAPAGGTAVPNPDGTVTYTPNGNFYGTDTFIYTVEDSTGIRSNVATVTVTVTAANDNPVANPDAATTEPATPVIINVLANDTDVDNVPPAAPNAGLTVTAVTTPTNGTATINANNTITYTSGAGFTGPATFDYTVSDGNGGTATATVTVTVNSKPVADNQSVTTPEDTPKPITLTASDTDGDPLTWAIGIGPIHGTLSGTAPNVTYTPASNYNGSDSFTFKVNDGRADSNVATVTIAVTSVNDAPTATNDSATTTTGSPVFINVLANDTDPDGAANLDNAVIASLPTGATLTCGGVTAAVGTACRGGIVTFTATTTTARTYTFGYRAQDKAGAVSGNIATVSVTVNVVNGPVDLDITALRVTGTASVGGTATIRLEVKNNGTANGQRAATVVGVRGGQQVYTQTVQVNDPLGGGSTAFDFPPYNVTATPAGNIAWTATIVDDNVDVDRATASTRVR